MRKRSQALHTSRVCLSRQKVLHRRVLLRSRLHPIDADLHTMLSYTPCFGCPSQGETGNRCVKSNDKSGAAPATVSERSVMATVLLHGKAMLSGGLFDEPPLASPETGPKNSDNKPAVGGRCSNPACLARGVFMRSFHPDT